MQSIILGAIIGTGAFTAFKIWRRGYDESSDYVIFIISVIFTVLFVGALRSLL